MVARDAKRARTQGKPNTQIDAVKVLVESKVHKKEPDHHDAVQVRRHALVVCAHDSFLRPKPIEFAADGDLVITRAHD
jgi:hypothetical protein